MARSEHKAKGGKQALAISVWLYDLFLYAYPAPFRRTYRERLVRVFRDTCRATLEKRGVLFLIPLWGQTWADLVWTACLERWQSFKENACSMVSSGHSQQLPARLWVALVATLLALSVELLASLHLYLLEDASRLSQAAYSASPLLRFSYDVIYLSALASGVAVCAVVGYALVHRRLVVTIGCVLLTLLVAGGGFGGLLVHHMLTFLVFLLLLFVLTLSSFLLGRVATARSGRDLSPRPAAVLGACVSAGAVLLVNLVALVLHTLSLNPVSHALYMQGQIVGTHLNALLLAMVLALLTGIICMVCLLRAFRLPSPQS
ncbi:MAG TPA: hypothetical protein VFV38_35660 [Ktedonobacteraceae bacterium]|nr:hypothetical protein [Ktedonobacteraceae bacterium]